MNAYRCIIKSDKKLWPSWFKRTIHYIENNFNKKLSLGEISRNAGISRYHFCRTFKILTGRPVIDYINNIRIEKAKELLKESVLSITEISLEAGFNNISNFNRTFKNIIGMNPSSFRRNSLL